MINIGSLGDLYAAWARAEPALKINQSAIGFWTHLHSGELKKRFRTSMELLTQSYTRSGPYRDRQAVERAYVAFDRCTWRPRLALFTDLRTRGADAARPDPDRARFQANDASRRLKWLRGNGCAHAHIDRGGAIWYRLPGQPWRRSTHVEGLRWISDQVGAPGEDRTAPFSAEHFVILSRWAADEVTRLDAESGFSRQSFAGTYTELLRTALPNHVLLEHIRAPQYKPLGKPLLAWIQEELPTLACDRALDPLGQRRTRPAACAPGEPNWLGRLLSQRKPRGGIRRGGWSHSMYAGGAAQATAAVFDRDQMYERRESYMLEFFAYEQIGAARYDQREVLQELDIQSPPTEHRGGGRVPPGTEQIYAHRGGVAGASHPDAARLMQREEGFLRRVLPAEQVPAATQRAFRNIHEALASEIRGERYDAVTFDEETDPPPSLPPGQSWGDPAMLARADFT